MMTPADYALAHDLRNPEVRVLGRARLTSLLDAVDRQQQAMDAAEVDAAQARFIANNLWLAAAGVVGEEEIMAHPRLADASWDAHRTDLLALVQLRYEAEAYRALMGRNSPALPTATPSPIAVSADPFPATL